MRLKENEIIQKFWSEAEKYAPLKFKSMLEETLSQDISPDIVVGTFIEFCIAEGPCFKAMVEAKTMATPKIISQAAQQLTAYLRRINDKTIVPVIIVPYMGTEQAKLLQRENISWIDLSGNMWIKAPNLYIERTGKLNKFPDTAPIKKIFQGVSSLVSRALLLKSEGFFSLDKIVDFINSRNANITLSTVSKVLKSLEQELFVDKSKSLIRARDPEKLLDKLTEGYISSTERKTRKTYKFAADNITNLFFTFFEQQVDYAACGFYAAKLKGLAVTNEIIIFVKDIEQVRKASECSRYKVEFIPDAEFGNLTITETNDPGVWFNVSRQINNAVVDDIELYLEMMTATPRGPEIAKQIKQRILKRTDIDG